MCLSAYWQWKLTNECARIAAVILKYDFDTRNVSLGEVLTSFFQPPLEAVLTWKREHLKKIIG